MIIPDSPSTLLVGDERWRGVVRDSCRETEFEDADTLPEGFSPNTQLIIVQSLASLDRLVVPDGVTVACFGTVTPSEKHPNVVWLPDEAALDDDTIKNLKDRTFAEQTSQISEEFEAKIASQTQKDVIVELIDAAMRVLLEWQKPVNTPNRPGELDREALNYHLLQFRNALSHSFDRREREHTRPIAAAVNLPICLEVCLDTIRLVMGKTRLLDRALPIFDSANLPPDCDVQCNDALLTAMLLLLMAVAPSEAADFPNVEVDHVSANVKVPWSFKRNEDTVSFLPLEFFESVRNNLPNVLRQHNIVLTFTDDNVDLRLTRCPHE